MDTQETSLKDCQTHDIDYERTITEFSWWTSREGKRRFVLTRIQYDFSTGSGNAVPYPNTVLLLEVDKTEPAQIGWAEFVSMVAKGNLNKTSF